MREYIPKLLQKQMFPLDLIVALCMLMQKTAAGKLFAAATLIDRDSVEMS